jgi:hypothetical protein
LEHGAGTTTLHKENGDVFTGQYAEGGKTQGRMEHLKSGSVYVGMFSNNVMHGEGRMDYGAKHGGRTRMTDARSYEGQWHKGVPHGQGCVTYKNGDVYSGGISRGQRNGTGRTAYTSGVVFEGGYLVDMRHGEGRVVFAGDGRVLKGEWDGGELVKEFI